MKRHHSIQKKLFRYTFGSVLAAVLSIYCFSTIIAVLEGEKHRRLIGRSVHENLESKGKMLVTNNRRVLQQFAEDNAFSSVQELLTATVNDDRDVVQAIYMDRNRRPWAMVTARNPGGGIAAGKSIDDSISRWADGLEDIASRRVFIDGKELIEVAGPVKNDGEKLGTIRYTICTETMRKDIAALDRALLGDILTACGVIALTGAIILLLSYRASRRQAGAITHPLFALAEAVKAIEAGNYLLKIEAVSDDEVGMLASQFERMRKTVQEYTETLEQKVAERTEQLETTNTKLARSNQELEQFAYVASHDLREPLRMVSSYTQLLAKRYSDKLDADAKDFIGFAVDGAKRMQALIDDLLMFSRVGTKAKEFEPTDMNDVLSIVLKNLEVARRDKKGVVTCDTMPVIVADKSQMIQLLQNLVANALKFCKERAPAVRVLAAVEDKQWRFGVRDNGIGIAPEHRKRIFQIFQRLHTRDEYPGSGIGLAVCKKIVERHGGGIVVESEVGKGTTFWFTIPLRDMPSAARTDQNAELI